MVGTGETVSKVPPSHEVDPVSKSGVNFRTAIVNHYGRISVGALLTYGVLLAGLYYNKAHSSCPICELPLNSYSSWTSTISCMVSGAFISTTCAQILRMCMLRLHSDHAAACILTLTVNVISGVSNALIWMSDIGGVCRDRWGVTTPAVTWIEWIVCVPLLGYIVVTTKLQSRLDREDQIIIFGLFICILMGSLLQTTDNLFLSVTYLFFSSVSVTVVFITVYQSQNEIVNILKSRNDFQNKDDFGYHFLNATRRYSISCVFSVMMMSFPIVYYGRIFQVLSNDACHIGLILCSCFSKILFASVIVDTHLEVASPLVKLLAENIAINSSRRKFLRYIFHEMRVPLNSISLAVQLLLEEISGTKSLEETVLIIYDSVRFMGESLNDVMAIQKIEEGALQLIQKPYSVWDICSLVAGQYELEVLAKNLNINIHIADEVPKYLIGDKFRISHVISNVLSNAVKFSSVEGVIEIRVTCTTGPEDPTTNDSGDWYVADDVKKEKKFLRFSIRDYGSGISEDKMKDLFTPFVHLKDGEISKGRSTGIGLAICEAIARLHHGTIFCHSDGSNKGAIFVFVFPFYVEDVELAYQNFIRMEKIEPDQSVNKARSISPHGILEMSQYYQLGPSINLQRRDQSEERVSPENAISKDICSITSTRPKIVILDPGFTVLVVDDVLSNRKLLSTLLQKRNAEVDMAIDGIDALEKVSCHEDINHYRMIFLDNTMPRMSGLQCTRELRDKGYTNLIIGVTGNTMEEELVEFSNVGADIVLTKPMKPSQLDMLLRYSNENGVASQYIRGMNIFIGKEKVIICPKNSSSTINQATMRIKHASQTSVA